MPPGMHFPWAVSQGIAPATTVVLARGMLGGENFDQLGNAALSRVLQSAENCGREKKKKSSPIENPRLELRKS